MWHPDRNTEQLLQEIGITFAYKAGIPIKSLKVKESLKFNARIEDSGQVDDDSVAKYAADMSRGFTFPALVVKPDGLILAGNQRTKAAQIAGRTTVDAYVIDPCSDAQVDDFIRRDNCNHGKPMSEESKIEACVHLHRLYKTSFKELCGKYFGGGDKFYAKIVNANSARTVEERLLEKHIHASLPKSTLVALHPIQDANILCDAYRLAADYGLPFGQVDEMVSIICKKDSEAERRRVIVEKKAELEKRVKTGVVRNDVVLRKHLVGFLRFLEAGCDGGAFPPIEKLTNDKDQRAELKAHLDEVIAGLKRLKEKTR